MTQPTTQDFTFPQRIKISRENLDHPDDRPSPTMQAYIQEVVDKYGCDLTAPKADLNLTLPDGSAQLIISRIDQDLILVARMVPENGRWWEDPSLLLLDTTTGWVPFEVMYAPELWDAYVAVMPADEDAKITDEFSQPILANFTEYIAKQLMADEWLEKGKIETATNKEDSMLAHSERMQDFVSKLIQTYPAQTTESGVYLELSLGLTGCLVIREEEPETLYAVAFLRQDLNDLLQVDPELLFYVDHKTRWYPISIHRYWEGDAVAADYDLETKSITMHDTAVQQQLAVYADVLANQWQREAWTRHANPQLPSNKTNKLVESEDLPF